MAEHSRRCKAISWAVIKAYRARASRAAGGGRSLFRGAELFPPRHVQLSECGVVGQPHRQEADQIFVAPPCPLRFPNPIFDVTGPTVDREQLAHQEGLPVTARNAKLFQQFRNRRHGRHWQLVHQRSKATHSQKVQPPAAGRSVAPGLIERCVLPRIRPRGLPLVEMGRAVPGYVVDEMARPTTCLPPINCLTHREVPAFARRLIRDRPRCDRPPEHARE